MQNTTQNTTQTRKDSKDSKDSNVPAAGRAHLEGDGYAQNRPYSEEKANATAMKENGAQSSSALRGSDREEGDRQDSESIEAPSWANGILERAGAFNERIQTFVKERPLAILAGAIALGFVVDRFAMKPATAGAK